MIFCQQIAETRYPEAFAATGWRVGWLIGPPALTTATLAAHTKIVFCTNSPMQEAVALGLNHASDHHFFEEQLEAYVKRREALTSVFDKLGLSYTMPDGAYFVLVDMDRVKVPEGFPIPETCQGRGKDFILCWWMAQELKVVGIPPSEVGFALFKIRINHDAWWLRDCEIQWLTLGVSVLLRGTRQDW